MPRASVIMTVYNTDELYLREAIESILNQTFKDFEFIIIDDCSKEPIADIVNSYQDERIKLIRNEKNLGVTLAPNVGLDVARGDYIFKMDSDDIAYPNRLEKQVEFLDNNPETDIVSAAIEQFPKKKIVVNPLSNKDIKNTLIFKGDCVVHPCVAIRRSSILKYALRYESTYEACEDYALWIKNIDKLNFANLPDILLKYRWHGNNISSSKGFVQKANSLYLMLKEQGRYFSINTDDVLEIITRFKNKETIYSKDIFKIINFMNEVKSKLKKQLPDIEYTVDDTFMKCILRKCVKDFNFIRVLFSKDLKNLVSLSLYKKIGIIFGI